MLAVDSVLEQMAKDLDGFANKYTFGFPLNSSGFPFNRFWFSLEACSIDRIGTSLLLGNLDLPSSPHSESRRCICSVRRGNFLCCTGCRAPRYTCQAQCMAFPCRKLGK